MTAIRTAPSNSAARPARAGGPTRLRRLAEAVWASAAGRGGAVFVAASLVVGLSNFVFHLVLSRLLGPAAYGAMGALLNVTSVLSVPLSAVSVTVAQSVAQRADGAGTPPLGRLLRLAAAAGVAVTAGWLAATPTLDRFFHLHTPGATVVLGLWLVPAVPAAVLEGVVLGERRFRVAGVGQLAGVGVRLAVGVALVSLGFGVAGAMAATVASGGTTVAVYGWALRRQLVSEGRFVPRAGQALLSTVSIGGAAVLTSIDAWLARHFLAAEPAGLFTAAATAGNIALFLPGAITMVYFPRMAASRGRGPEARRALARCTGLVATLGLAAAAVMGLAPRLVVLLLFGSAFAHVSAAIGTVAVADAGIGVASCLIYHQVARSSRLALAAWPTCLLALVLAAAFHGSIEVVALDMLVASGVLVVGLGVPTVVDALGSLADDTASLPRRAVLLEPATVDLTVVVPFHNVGAARLAGHLQRICDTLDSAGVTFEVVPVSDGSTDGSEAGLAGLPTGLVRPIVLADNRGKGEALRIGLACGQGRYLGFIDGDGDIPADGLTGFVDVARRTLPDVVVGSKRHPDAQVAYPPIRRIYSASYQALTAALFGLQVRDTQTGIKLIRRDVVAEVLPRMVEKRFAFDLELLAVARRLGYRQMAELPVTIGERFPSTISPRSVWRMLQDTLAVFWRLRVLGFYDPPLVEAAPLGADVATVGSAASGEDRSVPVARSLAERLAAGERLRVLVCNWRDLAHPHAGGAEVYTHRVAQAWVAAGHQVTWFCAAVAGRPSVEEVDGITVVRRGGRHSVYRQTRRFWERQGRGRFDLVVDEVNTRPFEAKRWAGDTPVVALVHQVAREVWFHELAWPVALAGRFLLEPRWLRRLRSVPVLTVSPSSATSLAGFGVTDVTVVPEGVDPVVRPAVAREAVPTVVWVGRLAANKRPDHAVEAFRQLQAQMPSARLWLVGSGPMEARLRASLPEGAELLGRLDEADKRERLARAHCLVATSVREGWGLTVTEAAQVGTPAVGYDVPGLRDSVAASDGVLVAPSPAALADALAERLPRWAGGAVPTVRAGGVLPWAAVADELMEQAARRTDARRQTEDRGEDVAVAWRRWVAPLAAWCDRRAWTVAGVASMVAVAPLAELGASAGADAVAGVAVVCLTLAVVGAWADAVRWPLVRPGMADPGGTGAGGKGPGDADRHAEADGAVPGGAVPVPSAGRRRRRWAPLVGVGAAVGTVAQPWLGAVAAGAARRGPAVGQAWVHQLGLAFAPGRAGASGALVAVLQLPVGLTGSLLHTMGGSAVLDVRLWETALLVAAGMAMAGLLTVLGLTRRAVVVGGVVYVVSPYVVAMSGGSVAYLAAMAVVPALVAWVLWAARPVGLDHRRLAVSALWLAALAVGLGLVAASPPLLVACASALGGGVLLAGWLQGRSCLGRALRRSAGGVVGLAVACAYWAVPFGLVLTSSTAVSAASHRNWQWATTRSTLTNSLWLNTAWDWADRAVFPFAGDFHRFPMVLWRYAVPVAACAALGAARWQARRRADQQRLRLLVAAAALALVVVVVATGTRAPGRPLFALLTAVPFGWLFEDPGRFLFVAGAGYAVMVALGVEGAPGRQGAAPSGTPDPADAVGPARARAGWLVPTAMCLVLAVPSFPLATGGVVARLSAAAHGPTSGTVPGLRPVPASGPATLAFAQATPKTTGAGHRAGTGGWSDRPGASRKRAEGGER